MVLGIGIDLVKIARFEHWHTFSDARLRKVFSQSEIDSYRSIKNSVQAQLFIGSRFALKEAFFKALSQSFAQCNITTPPFLLVCRAVSTARASWGGVEIYVAWNLLNVEISYSKNLVIMACVTHEHEFSIAKVLLQRAF